MGREIRNVGIFAINMYPKFYMTTIFYLTSFNVLLLLELYNFQSFIIVHYFTDPNLVAVLPFPPPNFMAQPCFYY